MKKRSRGERLCKVVFVINLVTMALFILSLSLLKEYYVNYKVLAASFDNSHLYDRDKKIRDIIFFGDSRVVHWESKVGLSTLNRGVSGETTSQMLLRFEKDVLLNESEWVVFQLGINDLVAAGLTDDTKADFIIEKCIKNISTMIDLSLFYKKNIVFVEVIKPGNFSVFRRVLMKESGIVDLYVDRVNSIIFNKYNHRISIIEVNDKIDSDVPYYYVDALHLNSNGYDLLDDELRLIIEN